tara:strand:- start:1441 stop:2835 length:1395 start_codon:yes stop_codon:yes gene_type:complete
MTKNKNNQTIWRTRIKKKGSVLFQKIGSSIEIDKNLYKQDILGSIVHVEMLFRQKIISFKIKNKIIFGLKKIESEIKKKKFVYKSEYEDIHMNIEKRLFEIIGDDAGFIHTARSRNDQVITDFKMWLKIETLELIKKLENLNKSILKVAQRNINTIMPGFTHLKNAQAVSFAHYMMAYIEMFNRDKHRFKNNLESLNENPLGVAALTGTSFNIDRNFTSKKLGFKRATNNSIDTVADRDFVLDFLYSASVCSLHISRISEEFIIWNSDTFSLINLSDKVVTGSSIMPQKKNPDTLEFLRGKTGTTFGNLFSMLTILKGLPLSYFKDLQDDKELVFKTNETLNNCISILNEVLNNFSPNKKRMLEIAENGYIVATDLADYLVSKHGMSFRNAYRVTSLIVNFAEKKKKKLNELNITELKKIEPILTSDVLKVFNLKYSVNSKKSYGGTSFANIKKMITKYKKNIL